MRRSLRLGALAAAILAAPAAARADGPQRVALRWDAPAGCPSAGDVGAEVDRILGEAGARPATPLDVRVAVTGVEGAYRARVETIGVAGPRARTLQGKTCAAVADAAALVIALVIDPTVVPKERPSSATTATTAAGTAAAGTAETAPPAPAAPPVAPPVTPEVAPVTPPPATPRAAVVAPTRREATRAAPLVSSPRVGASGLVDVGSLPGAGGGFVVDAAIHVARARLELGFALLPTRQQVLAASSDVGGAVGLWTVGAAACLPFAFARFELAPCVGGEAGRIHGDGFGVTDPASGGSAWGAARAGGMATWFPYGPVGLAVRVEAAVPFNRPSFVIENVGAGTVYRPSPVVARFAGGLEARF